MFAKSVSLDVNLLRGRGGSIGGGEKKRKTYSPGRSYFMVLMVHFVLCNQEDLVLGRTIPDF